MLTSEPVERQNCQPFCPPWEPCQGPRVSSLLPISESEQLLGLPVAARLTIDGHRALLDAWEFEPALAVVFYMSDTCKSGTNSCLGQHVGYSDSDQVASVSAGDTLLDLSYVALTISNSQMLSTKGCQPQGCCVNFHWRSALQVFTTRFMRCLAPKLAACTSPAVFTCPPRGTISSDMHL